MISGVVSPSGHPECSVSLVLLGHSKYSETFHKNNHSNQHTKLSFNLWCHLSEFERTFQVSLMFKIKLIIWKRFERRKTNQTHNSILTFHDSCFGPSNRRRTSVGSSIVFAVIWTIIPIRPTTILRVIHRRWSSPFVGRKR